LVIGAVLVIAATLGKLIGAGGTAAAMAGTGAGVLIGVSMVPRAEIAMIIMEHGRGLGDWAVPEELFGGMVMVTLATCLLTPPVVRRLLARGPRRGV
jgi:Kef-type K+ transport system membrane component KefB